MPPVLQGSLTSKDIVDGLNTLSSLAVSAVAFFKEIDEVTRQTAIESELPVFVLPAIVLLSVCIRASAAEPSEEAARELDID